MKPRLLAVLAVLALVLTGSTVLAAPASATTTLVSARSLLKSLAVRAANYSHSYDRDRFHYPIDADGDGCNTRKEVLIQEHRGSIRISRSCAVYGTWKSQYDNRITTNPYSLQIDHMVSLAEAWHSGAWAWSRSRLTAFGNDVGYKPALNAVTTSLNYAKGAKDPARWLPPRNRCTYLKEWIGVKYRWHLTVDSREKAAISAGLTKYCRASPNMAKPGAPNISALT